MMLFFLQLTSDVWLSLIVCIQTFENIELLIITKSAHINEEVNIYRPENAFILIEELHYLWSRLYMHTIAWVIFFYNLSSLYNCIQYLSQSVNERCEYSTQQTLLHNLNISQFRYLFQSYSCWYGTTIELEIYLFHCY